jgi:hypothetical protein
MMFELVNPIIIGSYKTIFNEKTPYDNANLFWKTFVTKLINYIPQMCFTFKDKKNKLYHFCVNEMLSVNNDISFIIKEINLNLDSEIQKTLLLLNKNIKKNYKNIKNNNKQPESILYYHYVPSIYSINSLSIPTFNQQYNAPFISIELLNII